MNATPEQATSFVNFYESMRSKMEAMINASQVGFSESKQRTPTSPRRHLRTNEQKLAMIKDVLELVNQGESWRSAVAVRGQGYEPSSVIRLAKAFGLYESAACRKKHKADRKRADKALPIIEQRRAEGMTVKEAVAGSGITADQYYRAKERAGR